MDLISVIVPIYNVSKYVERCINSLISQTYSNIEIVLVDDGSKDDSGKICDIYAAKYNNIKVIHKINEGLGYARNTGLLHSNGKYIIFIDGDDYVEIDMIECLYNDAIKNNADTCIGGFKRVYSNHVVIKPNKFSNRVYEGRDVINNVLVKMCGKFNDPEDFIEMSVWKVLFSHEIIKNNNIQFPSERELISEDIIFDFQYYRYAKRVYMSSNIGYCYCDNEDSLTTKYRNNRFELQKKLYEVLTEKSNELQIYDANKERLKTTFISIARYCIKQELQHTDKIDKKLALKNITTICNDNCLNEALKDYSYKELSIKSKLINYLIKHKKTRILYNVVKLKVKFNI